MCSGSTVCFSKVRVAVGHYLVWNTGILYGTIAPNAVHLCEKDRQQLIRDFVSVSLWWLQSSLEDQFTGNWPFVPACGSLSQLAPASLGACHGKLSG